MQKPEMFEDSTNQICLTDCPEDEQKVIKKLKEPIPMKSCIEFKIETKYWFDNIDSNVDAFLEYQMSWLGLKRSSSGYDVEHRNRDIMFEKAIVEPTWIHVNTDKQHLALLKGLAVIEEYNINKGLSWYGISHVTKKIFNVKEYYNDEPKDMLEDALTGTALELDIFRYDKNCGYRNVAIHGTRLHEKLPRGKDDGDKEQIIRLKSDGCVLLNNDDMFYVYENVEIGCPIVFDNQDVFRNLIPIEILTWCDINKIQNVIEHLAKGKFLEYKNEN